MIPTLIMVGAVLGRWWRVTLLASAIGWPVLLVATGAVRLGPAPAGAAGLAVLNAGPTYCSTRASGIAAGSCGEHWPRGGTLDAIGLPCGGGADE